MSCNILSAFFGITIPFVAGEEVQAVSGFIKLLFIGFYSSGITAGFDKGSKKGSSLVIVSEQKYSLSLFREL